MTELDKTLEARLRKIVENALVGARFGEHPTSNEEHLARVAAQDFLGGVSSAPVAWTNQYNLDFGSRQMATIWREPRASDGVLDPVDIPLHASILSAYLSTTSAGVTEQMLTIMRQHVLIEAGDDELRAALEASLSSRVDAPVSQKEAVAVDTEWLARASVSIADMVDDWYRSLTVKGTASIPPDLVMRRLERFAPAPAGEPGISERLYDADEPMADGEIRMTAAENVLGWLLTEKIGVPDDRNYSPNEAQEILVRRLDYANEMENERIRSALHPTPTPVSAPVGVVEALEPFVRHYEAWMDRHSDDTLSSSYSPHTFGQLRRARAVLAALRSPAVGEVSPNA